MDETEREFLSVLGYFFLLHGHPERAIVVFEGLEALLPDDPGVAQGLAYARLKLGRHAEVIAALDGLLRRAGPAPSRIVHFIRARALWELGRTAEARAAVARFVAAGGPAAA